MKLTLGFSPCPNDTFIFDALVHGRIDTGGLEFDYELADVEELNRKAFTGDLDITKMSCFAYVYAAQKYLILDSGSALGHGNGPLLIGKQRSDLAGIADMRIAIPGRHTTANMLFSIAWPGAENKTEYIFSDIERALLDDEVDAGLIIHETRFTYSSKGLVKLADLGEFWGKMTRLPIPLGIIVINRRIPEKTAHKVNRLIKESLEYAYTDAIASYDFVVSNAKEMDSRAMNNHIKMFVNKYSLNLGKEGRRAINELFRIAREKGIIPALPGKIFLTSL